MEQVIREGSHFVALLPALKDNYIFILGEDQGRFVAVIDPGEASPVIEWCHRHKKVVSHILLTHHHLDHIGGVRDLMQIFDCKVISSKYDQKRIPDSTQGLDDNESLNFCGFHAQALAIPGHTLGHMALYLPQQKWLFPGDTLFSLGCGRLFEGSASQLMNSLERLARLPGETLAFCAHEYTLTNGRFALSLIPEDQLLKKYLKQMKEIRDRGQATIPTTLSDQIQLNPFYRTNDPRLRKAIEVSESASPLDVFTRLRELRNQA